MLFAITLLVRGGTAMLEHQPHNMDEAYHTVNAQTLATGGGFSENFIWNYLSPPKAVTHAGNRYWMPLTAMLAATGMVLGGANYAAGQWVFILLSALLPPLTFWLAMHVTGNRRQAWSAGLLVLFSGFYFAEWTAIDTFTPFALAVSISLIALWRAIDTVDWRWTLAAGITAGLAHLTRADGVLVAIFGFGFLVYGFKSKVQSPKLHVSRLTPHASLFSLGYLLPMSPWFIRNWRMFGAILPPGGSKTLWLTKYADIFSTTATLSLQSYLTWGWGNILQSKLWAMWMNFQSLAAVIGLVVVFPFAIIGWWKLRKHPLFQLSAIYLALLWLAMTFAFTFPGVRGALFHSGGAVLPMVAIAGVVGLDALIKWVAQYRRDWNIPTAKKVFGGILVFFAALISLFTAAQKLSGWNSAQSTYAEIIATLSDSTAVMMAIDPPAIIYFGGESAIAIPNDPPERVITIARKYGARYLILERSHPAPLDGLYRGDGVPPEMKLLGEFGKGVQLYEMTSDE